MQQQLGDVALREAQQRARLFRIWEAADRSRGKPQIDFTSTRQNPVNYLPALRPTPITVYLQTKCGRTSW